MDEGSLSREIIDDYSCYKGLEVQRLAMDVSSAKEVFCAPASSTACYTCIELQDVVGAAERSATSDHLRKPKSRRTNILFEPRLTSPFVGGSYNRAVTSLSPDSGS